MATIVAVRSGNWSDTSHVTGPWPGASTPTTKPGVGDTVQTDEYVVEIDEDVHVAVLEATGSGYFAVISAPTLPAVRAITANVLNNGTMNGALKISNPAGLVEMTGDATGGIQDNAWGILNTGVMGDIVGNVNGGGVGRGVPAFDIDSSMTRGGGAENSWGLKNDGVMGNVVGNVNGGVGPNFWGIYNNGVMGNVVGNVTGGNGDLAWGIHNNGVMGNIVGSVNGGTGNSAWGIHNNGGTVNDIIGIVTSGSGYNAYAISNLGIINCVNGSLICGATGQFPVYGPFRLAANPANAITVVASDDTLLTLSNDYPAEADVKSGVDYNRGTMTGEMAAGGNIGPVSIVIGGGGIRIS